MSKSYPSTSSLYLRDLDVSCISPWPIQGLFNVIEVFHFLAVQVIFICVYITNYLHFITKFLSFKFFKS